MNWLDDHQVLLAGLALVAFALLGVVVLVVRAVGFVRTARSAQKQVETPVAAISAGLTAAEKRVGAITEGQAELEQAIDRVGRQAGELRLLIDHAGRALSVLRAPLKYFGK